MSKVATYLQGHVVGEVTTRQDARHAVMHDGSVLEQVPDMVIHPRTSNDIRKVMRFAWQLAEKGHPLGVTARGNGTDITGASIGKGIVLIMPTHFQRVYEYDSKQKLVRAQAGAQSDAVENALHVQGAAIPPLLGEAAHCTIGGAVAGDTEGYLAGKYGSMRDWVDRVEVVLDNGDVMQTGRISKREMNKKIGTGGREGDIYRGIDTILEDHASLIDQLSNVQPGDRSGYAGIVDVRHKNGSVDLTPLFIGSQGTLGVMTEMIVKTAFVPNDQSVGVAAFHSADVARDALDQLRDIGPAFLEYYDGSLIEAAVEQGNSYSWYDTAIKDGAVAAVICFGFDDMNERTQKKSMKKALKTLSKVESVVQTTDDVDAENLLALRSVVNYTALPTTHIDRVAPMLLGGFSVPHNRFEEFSRELTALGEELHLDVPLYGSALTGVYNIRPVLSLKKVGDKQKIMKLLDKLNALIIKYDGTLIAVGGEGRLLSRFARADWNDEMTTMVEAIKKVFDPHAILNPGVKTDVQLRDLATEIRSDNSVGLHAWPHKS